MGEKDDDKYMRRCLELASGAEGMTYPNPMVGSVIVHEGRIIGEGFHLKAGGPHAEVIAINSVKDKSNLRYSTLYVNLEPCSHFGKTPPCADFIIANSIPRIVIGTADTSDKVSGKGADKLIEAGCEVITGILEKECRWLNRRFFTFNEKRRPWIILKWAQSADGYIDIHRSPDIEPEPTWISGKPERVLVHKWRASEQAILVGAGTIRADNPKLNVREWKGGDPLKLILSRSGILENKLAVTEHSGTVVVFTNNINADLRGVEMVKLENNPTAPEQIVKYLHERGIQSLFIEGGAEVINQFVDLGLWDEARIFTGVMSFKDGVKAPEIGGPFLSEARYSGSILEIYLREASQVFSRVDNMD